MNSYDPNGDWVLNSTEMNIYGSDYDSQYGDLRISSTLVAAKVILRINKNYIPSGLSINLYVGIHEIVIGQIDGGCKDTVVVNVFCEDDILPPSPSSEYLELLLDSDTILCLDIGELLGNPISIRNICEEESTGIVLFDPDLNCISISGFEVGNEFACFEICDDQNICDTTFLSVDVVPDIVLMVVPPPIAFDDREIAVKNALLKIDVLENDEFDRENLDMKIISRPLYGRVNIDYTDMSLMYAPNDYSCGEQEHFVYEISNSTGSSEASVYIDITCDELIIYSGFSPNGDDQNDTWRIDGIENVPDAEILIFNRWGTTVFESRGYDNQRGWGWYYRWSPY